MGVGELDPEHGARPAQPGIDEHRPVVHIALGRAAAGSEAVAQGLPQRDRVLRISPAGRHHRPGMIVEERDEDRLAAGHVRAVQRVTDPAGVGPLGLEPAEHRRRPAVGARSVEPERGEVALQRPRRGRPPGVRGQHHRDLRGGPPRRLPLEPDRQLQHLGRGLRSQPPRRRDQRGEPTGPIRPDPAIQTRPAHPHRLGRERARMDPGRIRYGTDSGASQTGGTAALPSRRRVSGRRTTHDCGVSRPD